MQLRQSTATALSLGPFVDKSDAVTLLTGLVSALDNGTTGIKISKAGGALTVRHATVTATTYDGYGNYQVTLDTTDTATLGRLRVQYVDATTCLPVFMDLEVLTQGAWDALYSTFNLSVLTQADIRTATGLASANLDTQLGFMNPVRSNTATAGGSTSITLDGSASSTTDFYKNDWVRLTGGTGSGQARRITAYNGSTKVATVGMAWATNPDNTSTFAILAVSDLPTDTVGGSTLTQADVRSAVGLSTANLDTQLGSIAIDADSAATDAASVVSTLSVGVHLAVNGLSKNTAFTNLPFVMLDDSNHEPAAGLTVGVTRLVDGGSFGAGGLTNVQDKGGGVYTVDGISGDTNGKYITFVATATGADPTIFTVITTP